MTFAFTALFVIKSWVEFMNPLEEYKNHEESIARNEGNWGLL